MNIPAGSPTPPPDTENEPGLVTIEPREPVTPLVTYILLTVTVIVYAAQFFSEILLGTDVPALLGMKINELIIAGQWWRFITPMFLHGSLLHIGFNMYALLSFGSSLEREFGHARFLGLYLAGAFAGNVISFLLSPNPSLGASTAIFGLLGAEAVFLYQNRELFGGRARAALQSVLTIAGINFLIGLSPGIDNWGHFGGLLGGLVFTYLSGPLFELRESGEELELVDTNAPNQVWLGALAVLLIFGAAAAGKLLA